MPFIDCNIMIANSLKHHEIYNTVQVGSFFLPIENLNAVKWLHELRQLKQEFLKDIEWINNCFYNTSSIKATFPRHYIENIKYLLTEGVENKCIQKNKRLLTSD